MRLSLSPNRAIMFITSLMVMAAFYNSLLVLHGDEAYYWVWSKHLQSGYYDHAPLIAYFIKAATLISESEWGVRLVNILCLGLSSFVIYRIGYDYFDERKATYALLIFLSAPITNAGMIITTPDSPLILFWSLTLYYVLKAFQEGKTRHFLLAGFFLGLAMLSKYTAILLAGAIVIYLLVYRRDLFLNYKTYLAIFIACVVVTPMLWWNYQNDWISFTFQLKHGGMGQHEIQFNTFFEFLGGQFGTFGPLFMISALIMLYYKQNYTDKINAFLLVAFLTPLLFFLYKSLFERMHLNYDAPAFIAAAVLVANVYVNKNWHRFFYFSLGVSVVVSLIARVAFAAYPVYVQDRMIGFKESTALVQKHRKAYDALYGNHLSTAALMSYYLPDHPETSIATPTRFSQYDMWHTQNRDGLVLSFDELTPALQQNYEHIELVDTYIVHKGDRPFRTFYIYRVRGAKSNKPQ